MNRRTFTKKSGALLAGLAMPSWLKECKKAKMIGLQLWTIRDAMKADPVGSLKKLANMGYGAVESAGYSNGMYYNMKPVAFKKVLDDLGLALNSGHGGLGFNSEDKGTFLNEFERYVADAASIDQKYIVLAWIPEEYRTLDKYKELSELLNKNGEVAKKYGVQVAYHNHDFEFFETEGQIPYDLMLQQTDKDLVDFELDLYWIKKGGKHYKDYFEKHSGRFPLWHVKDMDNTEEAYFTEVGNGIIDFPEIFKCRKKSGMKFFYIEQDDCRNNVPLKSAEISLGYVRDMRY